MYSHHLETQIRAERKQRQPEKEGIVSGDIEALPASEDSDKYVIVKRKDRGKEGGSSEQH